MSARFLVANSVLVTAQAALVALPGRGVPAPLARFSGRGWALVPPASIAVVVAAIAAEPRVADGLTWLALVAIPPLAVAALAWAMRDARTAYGLLALPLVALALLDTGGLAADGAAATLTALSCVTLGRLLAGAVPGVWLKAGIVAMAVTDAILVFGDRLQGPDAVLNAAVPAPGLPQLQYLDLHYASLGYGDVFVAGVLGGVLAAERMRQWPVALLVLGLSCLWDLLFFTMDTLPATVPVALALVVHEGVRLRRAGSGDAGQRRHRVVPVAEAE
jgi:hypothetical protein